MTEKSDDTITLDQKSCAGCTAAHHPAPAFDCRAFRDALGNFATGIAVVSALAPDGSYIGLTINSFNSVSLDPPLILWSLALSSPNLDAFRACSHYAVNILAADQRELSQRFATRGGDKFGGLSFREGLGGAPIIPGCCAWFECANEVRHPGGDHLIFIGRVERCARQAGRAPLIYHGGRYRWLVQD